MAGEEVRSGVPQGSVLGPILFILYVNDLPVCLSSSRIAMFADDTKCFRPIRTCSDVGTLQKDLDALSAWALQNELSFQPAKCENLPVTRKRNSPPKANTLNGVTLKRGECARDLGVQVTRDISWNEHVRNIVSKAKKMLGFLRRHCSNSPPYEIQRTLYVSLVRSHLTYASQVWAPTLLGSLNLMRTLEAVQRPATSYILHGLELDYKQRLLKLSLFPVLYFLEYLDLLLLFRCIKGEIHLDISDTIHFFRSSTRRGSTGLDTPPLLNASHILFVSILFGILFLWKIVPWSGHLFLSPG